MHALAHLWNAGAILRHRNAGRDQILAFRDRQLRRMVAHAYRNVPYYRRLFDRADVTPEQIRTAADLPRLPITSKEDLQNEAAGDILARGNRPDRLIKRTTSGSTGEPLVIHRSWLEERVLKVIRLRGLLRFGLRRGDRLAIVHYQFGGAPPRSEQLLQRTRLYEYRSFHCLTPPADLLARLHSYEPDILTGSPSVLLRIGQAMEDGRAALRPRVVLSGSEILTPTLRDQLSEAFQAPVYDTYGSHEFSLFAWECPATRTYHVADDAVIVEVLREDGTAAAPGEQGEVVATGLHTFAMPFIRFRLEDVVTHGQPDGCICGAPWSTIHRIQGRIMDYFILLDGRELHPYVVEEIVERTANNWVRQYQFVQDRIDRLVFRLVPRRTPLTAEITSLREAMRDVLSPGMEVVVEIAERLDSENGSKFRMYRCLVDPAAHPAPLSR